MEFAEITPMEATDCAKTIEREPINEKVFFDNGRTEMCFIERTGQFLGFGRIVNGRLEISNTHS